jgi:hypothetical protein
MAYPEVTTDQIETLETIREQMIELLETARNTMRGTGFIKERAEAYWLAHIECALGESRTYSTTMSDTIKEMREHLEPRKRGGRVRCLTLFCFL